jgi:hypothetical protein
VGLAWRARSLDDRSRGQGRGVGQIARTAMGVGWWCRHTALHVASGYGHTATAKALVAAGADVHRQDPNQYGRGVCPIRGQAGVCLWGLDSSRWQAAAGCRQIAREAMGVGWRCRDTALHYASLKGHTETAMALVAAGADVHRQNIAGYGRGCVACGASFERVCSTTGPGGRGEASGRSLARHWEWAGGAGIRRCTLHRAPGTR